MNYTTDYLEVPGYSVVIAPSCFKNTDGVESSLIFLNKQLQGFQLPHCYSQDWPKLCSRCYTRDKELIMNHLRNLT